MDIELRKYIQYRIRTLNKKRQELNKLREKINILKQEIIDESPLPPDGQPKGKGLVSSPVETKLLRIEKMEKRVGAIDKDIDELKALENKIHIMGRAIRTIYKETIVGNTNPDIVAMSLNISRAKLFRTKKSLFEFIATELGYYYNDKKRG